MKVFKIYYLNQKIEVSYHLTQANFKWEKISKNVIIKLFRILLSTHVFKRLKQSTNDISFHKKPDSSFWKLYLFFVITIKITYSANNKHFDYNNKVNLRFTIDIRSKNSFKQILMIVIIVL